MPKYVKSADSLIKVKTPEGKEIEVTERAFNVIYEAKGYQRLDAVEVPKVNEGKPEETEPAEPNDDNDPDYFGFSREELKEIKNDKLKAFLEREGIEYRSDAVKEDLVDLILGE